MGSRASRQTPLATELLERFVAHGNYLGREAARQAAPIPGQSAQIPLQAVDSRERLFCS